MKKAWNLGWNTGALMSGVLLGLLVGNSALAAPDISEVTNHLVNHLGRQNANTLHGKTPEGKDCILFVQTKAAAPALVSVNGSVVLENGFFSGGASFYLEDKQNDKTSDLVKVLNFESSKDAFSVKTQRFVPTSNGDDGIWTLPEVRYQTLTYTQNPRPTFEITNSGFPDLEWASLTCILDPK